MDCRCQCGAVTFKTPSEKPLALYICHCADCRRQTSSAFGTSAIFPRFSLPDTELLSVYKSVLPLAPVPHICFPSHFPFLPIRALPLSMIHRQSHWANYWSLDHPEQTTNLIWSYVVLVRVENTDACPPALPFSYPPFRSSWNDVGRAVADRLWRRTERLRLTSGPT